MPDPTPPVPPEASPSAAEPALVAQLRAWNPAAVVGVKEEFGELTVEIERAFIRDACDFLKRDSDFNFFADVTCVDWWPREPRFEVVYHLLSIFRKQRVRLKVRLAGVDANVESVTSVYPAANFFEREIFDLFGVRFSGHPQMQRLMMPEDWQGHPLRKDYPVEGYR